MNNPRPHRRPWVALLGLVVTSLCLAPACIVVVEPTPDPVEPTPDPVEPTPDPVEPTPDPVEPTPDPVEPTPDPVDLSVSEETPMDAPIEGQASGSQEHAAVAFNGSHYLVVWEDERAADRRIYGARVLPDGTVLDPIGIPIATGGGKPAVASDGDGFLVVYRLDGTDDSALLPPAPEGAWGLRAVRVSAAGAVVGDPAVVADMAEPAFPRPRVAFDGTGYVVVWEHSGIQRARITPQGAVLDVGGIPTGSGRDPDVAFDGTSSLLVWLDDSYVIVAQRLSPAGDLLDAAPFPVGLTDHMALFPAVGCRVGGCTVAWLQPWSDFGPVDGPTIRAARVTPAGAVLDANPLLIAIDSYPDDAPRDLSVGHDSEGSVVVWDHPVQGESGVRQLHVSHIDSQGGVSAGALLTDLGARPAVASDGEDTLVVYTDQAHDPDFHLREPGIAGRRLGQGGAPIDAAGFTVSLGVNGQRNPTVAFDGSGFVVAWSDDRNYLADQLLDVYAARVTLQGEVLDDSAILVATGATPQHAPQVSAHGEGVLVAWQDFALGEDTLAAARLDADGAVLDPAAIQLGYTGSKLPLAMSDSGGASLLAWKCSPFSACVAPVSEAGDISVASEIETEGGWFSASFDGQNHLIVWSRKDDAGLPQLRGARVTPQGALLDGPAGLPIAPAGTGAFGLSTVFDGTNHVVVWLDGTEGAPSLRAVRVSPAGEVLEAQPALVTALPADCKALALGPDAAAHDGTDTLVAFRSCGPLGADVLGVALDGQLAAGSPFAIATGAAFEGVPALASSGSGVTLATYTSFDPAAPIGARRVVSRLLTR